MSDETKGSREFVRASLTFDVKFRVISKAEYALSKTTVSQLDPAEPKSQIFDDFGVFNHLKDAGVSPELSQFLMQIDDKLDQILTLLSKDESETVRFKRGTALDIGGGGMKMAVDSPVDVGELVHIQLVLSRMPRMAVDVYGEVVRVDVPSEARGGFFYLGIKFSDLDINTREKIISSVFKQQRRHIRNAEYLNDSVSDN